MYGTWTSQYSFYINKLFWHTLNVTVTIDHSYMYRRQNVSNCFVIFCKKSHYNGVYMYIALSRQFSIFQNHLLERLQTKTINEKSPLSGTSVPVLLKNRKVHDTHIWNKRIFLEQINVIANSEIWEHGHSWKRIKI